MREFIYLLQPAPSVYSLLNATAFRLLGFWRRLFILQTLCFLFPSLASQATPEMDEQSPSCERASGSSEATTERLRGQNQETPGQASVRDSASNFASTEAESPIHAPPDLPERGPMPPPPAVPPLPPVPSPEPKQPLAWRAIANMLWLNAEGPPPPRCKTEAVFDASFAKTFDALLKAAKDANLLVQSASAPAGHLLLRAKDDPKAARLVFAVRQTSKDQTAIRVAVDPDQRTFDGKSLNGLFAKVNDLLNHRQMF